MKIIPVKLTNKKASTPCYVDDLDFDMVSGFKWRISVGYAMTQTSQDAIGGPTHSILMHRAILWSPKGYEIDHIDGNRLNNQRSNLRVCTPSQNQMNKTSYIGSSKFKGVSWNKKGRKWYASIKKEGKKTLLGGFKDEEEAAKAYDKKAKELHGEFARLNFPPLENK